MITVLLVGDESPAVIAHRAIPVALALAASALEITARPTWLATSDIECPQCVGRTRPDAVWCVPGSPYKNIDGALAAIRFARENQIPFLGTCGGFQHALIEIARNVCGLATADHAESNPESPFPLIAPLQCSLINESEDILLRDGSRLRSAYRSGQVREEYQCRFGLNPALQNQLKDPHLHFTAHSTNGSIRAFERTDHPFFIGTLFQPERSAGSGKPHPLVAAFLEAAISERNGSARNNP